ncbi:MAG: cyanophycin synthetase, partial [Candidatus Omnitrophica bacterium]|nr:cyanophycin synthetase [Candidatus Omnitrophota bacterium]
GVIEKVCDERGSRLILIGRDIVFKGVVSGESGEIFDLSGMSCQFCNLRSRLLGEHQVINAATAVGVIEALKTRGVTVSDEAVIRGIEAARWDGRLEVVSRDPYVVLDGAQNRASARTLVNAVKKIFKYKRLILVFGVSKDKDVKGMLEEMLPVCDSIILTKSKVLNRALDPAKIKEEALIIGKSFKDITLTHNTEEALGRALSAAGTGDLILITGSLFIVGEIKEHYTRCMNTI